MITAGLEDTSSFIGWIESRRGLHTFSISLIKDVGLMYGQVDLQSLVVDEELREILRPITDQAWFRDKLQNFKSVQSLAKGIQDIVHKISAEEQAQINLSWNESSLPQLLTRQLADVGWDRVMKVNEDFTIIQIRSVDSSGRSHFFDLIINPGYPIISPTIQATLPFEIETRWTKNSDLRSIVSVVDNEIRKYEALFDELSEIDTSTWVLEPAQPTFGTSTRRLAVERSCSIVLELNFERPRDMCNINFFGPPTRVNQFRLSLSRNLHLWSIEKSVRENMEVMLGVTLPCKHTDNKMNENLCEECGICYTYSISNSSHSNSFNDVNLNSKMKSSSETGNLVKSDRKMAGNTGLASSVSFPDQACGNIKCSKIYHFSCLVDWLHSLPSSKTSFGTLFGSCPYCQEAISVRVQR